MNESSFISTSIKAKKILLKVKNPCSKISETYILINKILFFLKRLWLNNGKWRNGTNKKKM